jgi:hypothetical protein
MAERTFTLEEAQMLLPVLEPLLRKAIAGKKSVEAADQEFQALAARVMMSGGTLLDVAFWQTRKVERERLAQHFRDCIAEIDSIGVQVKDMEIGLLDFPCVVGNDTILLCWKLGEEKIGFWHGVDEGFRGRKPIDERIAQAGDSRKPS